ncbi:MAG: hypothetical protein ACTSWQ_02435, partial [Candidatus Thorarchaeota archaeon]
YNYFAISAISNKVKVHGGGGTVFHNLSKSKFERLKLIRSDETIANKFTEIIDPMMQLIISTQEQSQTLTDLRNTLLPKLISGEIQIPDAHDGATHENI